MILAFRGKGLSPRVRGNPGAANPRLSRVRSIPACAGEPIPAFGTACQALVYPRVCGGTLFLQVASLPQIGLSPRVRGNLGLRGQAARRERSIPACAGEPRCPCYSQRRPQVYPRVCGGTPSCHQYALRHRGLSPRVRGNPEMTNEAAKHPGSIPACAGEPAGEASLSHRHQVYPRVCGGTGAQTLPAVPMRGLSPRVRGNRE